MKGLNVACGGDYRDGMVNLDLRGGDVVANATCLPFSDNSFTLVLANDILEHFWRDRTYEILTEWVRVLAPSGELTVRVPNLTELARRLLDGPSDKMEIIENIYGGHRWGPDGSFDTHHWGWMPEHLEQELQGVGLTVMANDLQPNMSAVGVLR